MEFVAGRPLCILYAGETGNSEEVAYDIQSHLPYNSVVCSLQNYDVLDLPEERVVVFVVSTTGDGDTPEVMRAFWSFMLKRSLSNVALQNVSYAVFGLGDSSYDKYNAIARKLDKRLQMLGGRELVSIGLGDDQAPFGYLTALNFWLGSLIQKLGANMPILLLPAKNLTTTHNYNVDISSSCADQLVDTVNVGREPRTVYNTTVQCNDRLTAVVWEQDVRHIRLRFPTRSTSSSNDDSLYEVGDVAVVHYHNAPELVARAVAVVSEGNVRHNGGQLSADSVLSIEHTCHTGHSRRPSRLSSVRNCTLQCLLEQHLDIGAVPKRSYCAGLAQYAANPEEADKLRELASAEGTDLYFDYCIQERMNYVEVLEEFPSCRPPLAVLLELVQTIPARLYSIASSPAMLPNEVELCVAVSHRRTPYGRKRTGLCSGYLARLAVNDTVRVSIKPGTIRGTPLCPPAAAFLATEPSPSLQHTLAAPVPIILVGPGTGVAPMRALMQHEICRQKLCALSASCSDNAAPGASAPQVWLFFGCRKSQRDFLYGADWSMINDNMNPYRNGDNTNSACGDNNYISSSSAVKSIRAGSMVVTTAFSQDQLVKEYVGHKIIANGAQICSLLLQGAIVFVAGSAKRMPADVRKAFATVLQQHADMTVPESEQFLALMGRKQKYFVEAW